MAQRQEDLKKLVESRTNKDNERQNSKGNDDKEKPKIRRKQTRQERHRKPSGGESEDWTRHSGQKATSWMRGQWRWRWQTERTQEECLG